MGRARPQKKHDLKMTSKEIEKARETEITIAEIDAFQKVNKLGDLLLFWMHELEKRGLIKSEMRPSKTRENWLERVFIPVSEARLKTLLELEKIVEAKYSENEKIIGNRPFRNRDTEWALHENQTLYWMLSKLKELKEKDEIETK